METKNNYLSREQIYANRINLIREKYNGNTQRHNFGGYAGQMNHFESIRFNSTPTKDWKGSDWMQWHKLLVKAFKDGVFKSGIKYSPTDSIRLANEVFLHHWNKSASFKVANFGGYSTDFFSYFKSVGLSDILSYFQAMVTPVLKGTTDLTESTGKVISSTGKTVESVSKGLTFTGKILPIVIVAAILLVGFIAYKKAV